MTQDDVVIIGSGIAALQLAVHLQHDLNVRILTKSKLRNANSYLAQGGIAAAIGAEDHPSKHFMDTLQAGRFYNDEAAVREIIYESPALIHEICSKDSVFDKNQNGELLLGMEGAHSEKRIVHSGGDATGKNVIEFLAKEVNDNVAIDEDVFVYELILHEGRCIGVKTKKPNGKIDIYYGRHIIIATGGCGQLYSYTSSTETVCGDGIAMAYLAGAEIADMEFVQFHPTMLFIDGKTKGLISEAVRGEGALLVTEEGTPIMEGVHPYKDLAPRHVVSQKIYEYVSKGNNIYLDITKIPNFSKRFPTITANCVENGIDLAKGRIPVVPGSHFLMGGIKTDLIGRTSVEGLYAIGEAACTGLHGANRLASNSLLEGLYQGKKLAEWINNSQVQASRYKITYQQYPMSSIEAILPDISVLQASMMEQVGIVRHAEKLQQQKNWLSRFKVQEMNDLNRYSMQDITKIFMLIVAELITDSAIKRTESRGGHYRSDFPFEDDRNWIKKTIIHKENSPIGEPLRAKTEA